MLENDTGSPRRYLLTLCGLDVSFKIDTGADISVISEGTYHRVQHRPPLQPTRISFHSPSGEMNVIGQFETVAKNVPLIIYVIRNDTDSLLDRASACAT